jgi:hypothetical protein
VDGVVVGVAYTVWYEHLGFGSLFENLHVMRVGTSLSG